MGKVCAFLSSPPFLVFLFLAVEPHPLKALCRLAVLSYLTRECYDEIHELPLPTHLKVNLNTPPRLKRYRLSVYHMKGVWVRGSQVIHVPCIVNCSMK